MPTPIKITPKQAQARRANGKLSQGPITAAGKAVSRMNATKYGFFTQQTLLPGESPEEFADFRMSWAASMKPENQAEQLLVDRMADAAWRLRRVPCVEAGMYTAALLSEQAAITKRQKNALLEHRLQAQPEEAEDPALFRELQAREREIREELNHPEYAMGRVFRRDAKYVGGFSRLSQVEMLLDRSFYRSIHELLRLQAIRRGTQYQTQNEPTAGS